MLAAILGALVAPSAAPVRVTPRPRRPDVAAMLTEALSDSPAARELHRLAREVAWRGTVTPDAVREAARLAEVLRDRARDAAEPAALVCALIRELLVDSARSGAMELDAAVRDAAWSTGHVITAAHEREAARMIEEVMP